MLGVLADKGGHNPAIGDTVDTVTTEAPGQTTGSESASAWARPTPTQTSQPGQPTVAENPEPPILERQAFSTGQQINAVHQSTDNQGRLFWMLAIAAVLLSVAAIGLTTFSWARPKTIETTTTTTASANAYPADQVAAAKKDACAAVMVTDPPITAAQLAVTRIPDRTSPEAREALANFQMVTVVETEYVRSNTRPEAPESVRQAVDKYVGTLLAEVDGLTRLLPDDQLNNLVHEVKLAGTDLAQACR